MSEEILRPSGEGWIKTWDCSTGSVHYSLVDEDVADDADYLSTATNWEVECFAIANTSDSSGATINHVDACIRGKYGATSGSLLPYIRNEEYGSGQYGDSISLGAAYALSTYVWSVNPFTSAAWTSTLIDSYQFGIYSNIASNTVYVSQFYIVVDYTAGGGDLSIFASECVGALGQLQ